MTRLIYLFSILLLSIPTSGLSGQLDQSEKELTSLIQQTMPSVAVVECRTYENDVVHQNIGCGVMVRSDGYILTSTQVVADARSIFVTFPDHSRQKATFVGTDELTGTSLLKVERDLTYPVPEFGDSDALDAGSFLLAIGNPHGLSFTPSTGYASSLDRTIGERTLIQVSMPIRPGDSGAPVFDKAGKLVGIVVAALSNGTEPHDASNNESLSYDIGFITPINDLKDNIDQFIETGQVERAWLGVQITDLTPSLAKQLGLNTNNGILVTRVLNQTPAHTAGLKMRDVVVDVNGWKPNHSKDLRQYILSQEPQTTVEFNILRNGQQVPISVELGRLH